MANRNEEVTFGTVPYPKAPRTKFKMQTVRRLQTMQHGKLTPFFVAPVYPGDTWQLDTNIFCRMDVSSKVPLDDIYIDVYYFFVPYRLLDEKFVKIFGDTGDPYDDQLYSAPYFELQYSRDDDPDGIYLANAVLDSPLFYLNYSFVRPSSGETFSDHICSYPLMAYWSICNYYFRDEQLQASVDLQSFVDTTFYIDSYYFQNSYNSLFTVNRLPDYFSIGFTSPQRGLAQTIPLSSVAPLSIGNDIYSLGGNLKTNVVGDANSFSTNGTTILFSGSDKVIRGQRMNGIPSSGGGATSVNSLNLVVDLSNAGGTIDQLLLNASIQDLYRTKAMYGTRYSEVLKGQWAIEANDYLLGNPLYLGGKRGILSNVPVLNTASETTDMSGNSATLFNDDGFFHSFIEHGLIMGLCCTRIKHTYAQGLDHHLYRNLTELDFYNRAFANIGFQGKPVDNIYNEGYIVSRFDSIPVFNYDQAWDELRQLPSRVAGGFSPLSGSGYIDLRTKWSYVDYYQNRPTFNPVWLGEDHANVARTLTGTLLPFASNTSLDAKSHQYMMAFYSHPVVTRELPAYSIPPSLGKRF